MKTKSLLLGSFFLGVFLSIGQNIEAYAESSNHWQGFYAGLAIGGAYGKAVPDTEALHDGYFIENGTGNDKEQLSPFLQQKIDGWDITGSALAGYDFKAGNVTFGIEGDLTGMNYSESSSAGPIIYDTNAAANFTTQTTTETKFIFSLRPKIGYAMGDFHLYASAGPSVSKFKTTFQFSDTFGGGNNLTFIDQKTAFGASSSLGAGYQIGDNWSLRGDYVFAYFPNTLDGKASLNNDVKPDFRLDSSFQSHMLRFALIKHF